MRQPYFSYLGVLLTLSSGWIHLISVIEGGDGKVRLLYLVIQYLFMVEVEVKRRLKDEEPALWDKVGPMAPLDDAIDRIAIMPMRDPYLYKNELMRGLGSEAGHEFFARIFTRKFGTEGLMNCVDDRVNDSDILGSVKKLTENPKRLGEELLTVMGGHAHPWRASRLADFIATKGGSKIFNDMLSSPEGKFGLADFFSDPVGSKVIGYVDGRVDPDLVKKMTESMKAGQGLKNKES